MNKLEFGIFPNKFEIITNLLKVSKFTCLRDQLQGHHGESLKSYVFQCNGLKSRSEMNGASKFFKKNLLLQLRILIFNHNHLPLQL